MLALPRDQAASALAYRSNISQLLSDTDEMRTGVVRHVSAYWGTHHEFSDGEQTKHEGFLLFLNVDRVELDHGPISIEHLLPVDPREEEGGQFQGAFRTPGELFAAVLKLGGSDDHWLLYEFLNDEYFKALAPLMNN